MFIKHTAQRTKIPIAPIKCTVYHSPEIQSRPSPVDSMREAMLTVSPKRQYLGIACPTTPVHAINNSHNMRLHGKLIRDMHTHNLCTLYILLIL